MARRIRNIATLFTLASLVAGPAVAGAWTATWYASPQASWSADFPLPTGVPAVLEQQTVRETARISVGGTRVRIVLSNRYGTQPVHIGAARVERVAQIAQAGGGPGLALTFGGALQATIAPGAPLVSDPVDLRVAALDRLAISVYLPHATPLSTFHWGAQQTGWIDAGDSTTAPPGKPVALHGRALLAGVLVESDVQRDVVVALGDSITDGNGSTPDRTGAGPIIWRRPWHATISPWSMPAFPARGCWATAWAPTPPPGSPPTCWSNLAWQPWWCYWGLTTSAGRAARLPRTSP